MFNDIELKMDFDKAKGACSACMYLKINDDHNFSMWMRCGLGSNTNVELLSLWRLLLFASMNGIVIMKVLGDSKIVVN